MPVNVVRLQGQAKVNLFWLGREISNGSLPKVSKGLIEAIERVRSLDGLEVEALEASGCYIIEIESMMFWVSCKEGDPKTITFVSSRRIKY